MEERRVLKVLIAEDDLMVADMIKSALIHFGFEVCGIARTVQEAVAIARHKNPDLAVIDVRLADGGLGTEIAAELSDLTNLGILYATGNKQNLTAADGHACLVKPYSEVDLIRGLEIVAEFIATGTVSPLFPRRFYLLKTPVTAPRSLQPDKLAEAS